MINPEIISLGNAGKIIRIIPNKESVFQEKAWRVFMGLNPEWVYRAMKIDQGKVKDEFKRRGYEWRNSANYSEDYCAAEEGESEEFFTFRKNHGGLAKAILQICMDPEEDLDFLFKILKYPIYARVIYLDYNETNMDTPKQQMELISLCKEYIEIIDVLME